MFEYCKKKKILGGFENICKILLFVNIEEGYNSILYSTSNEWKSLNVINLVTLYL